MEIKRIKILELIPDSNNAREHNQRNLDTIKSSLAKFSQVEPLIVNKRNNVVIGGNGRLEAMKQLGLTEVEVNYVDLDNTQASALSLALNRSAELATWNEEILQQTLNSLKLDDFKLDDIGFSIDDLNNFGFADKEKDAIEDDVPEVPKETFVKLGDMFLLDPYLECSECKTRFPYDASKVDTECPICSK
jgi:hypothetical protein